MPAFRFQFTDARGQILEGTLQAADAREAESVLRQRGYPNVSLVPPVAAPIQAPVNASPPQSAPPVAHAPSQTRAVVRTKKGSDKQRFFLFAQFSKLLDAGINPAKAFDEVARVTRYDHYQGSFRELSNDATHGRPLSGTMARYPDLYPDHVVGMVRAGEAGGFVPAAFMELSHLAEEAYKFKRFHWFIWYLIPRALMAIPIALAFAATIRTAAERGSGDLLSILGGYLAWPYGPMTLAIAAILLLGRWWLGTHAMRHVRHAIGLKAPIYGPRARNESIAVFTWTLSRLAKAGIPPNTAWRMALAAVPNLEMQRRLDEAGTRMHDGSRLSEAIFGSKLFPEEYAPVISTGEMVGDLTGALDQLERVSRTEYDESTRKARWSSLRIGMVFAIATSGLIVVLIVKAWYVDVIKIFAPEVFERIVF